MFKKLNVNVFLIMTYNFTLLSLICYKKIIKNDNCKMFNKQNEPSYL